jgi:acetylornithine deacetylase
MQAQLSASSIKTEQLYSDAIKLLSQLISIPSFSKEEDKTAACIESFLKSKNLVTHRDKNNVWCYNKYFDISKPTLLLNSHHDTVRPASGYTRDPFTPFEIDGKLYGLGSNDAGGCLVALMAAFLNFYDQSDLKFNLAFAATAEEEISGFNGLELVFPKLKNVSCAIVGEPTNMRIAVAEKGLLVLDCTTCGKAGHAARDEGDNAIYKALADIEWFRHFEFPKVSGHLGKIKMNVTMIQSGTQHNMVPAECNYTVDIRLTDAYAHEEIIAIIKENVSSSIHPRSVRIKPSAISEAHPLVKAGKLLGKTCYGSPTTSDQALLNVPSIKMGPGDSARSHTADEFIYTNEIKEGISTYVDLINNFLTNTTTDDKTMAGSDY